MNRSVAALVLLLGSPALGEESPRRVPLPEPIFTETVSDIDGVEGDVEVELNGETLHAFRGGARLSTAEVEAEWLLMRRLGFRLEARLAMPGAPVGGSAGASWKLVEDFTRDQYMQLEAVAHTLEDTTVTEPGESPLPFTFDLRAAKRFDWLTLRANVGVALGGRPAGFPLRGGIALMTGFARSLRYGFWGIELDADGSRAAPFVLALDLIPNLASLGLPFRIGIALPWTVGADPVKPALGLFVRLFFESSREVEFGRTGR